MRFSSVLCAAAVAQVYALQEHSDFDPESYFTGRTIGIPGYKALYDQLKRSVDASNGFRQPINAYAYFVAKSYCDADKDDALFDIKKNVAYQFLLSKRSVVFENTIVDSLRTLDVLSTCKNPIAQFFNIEADMLAEMDPFALFSLPKLALRLQKELDFDKLRTLANIKLTKWQLKRFDKKLLTRTYTPFVTPALIVELAATSSPQMNDFVNAAAPETIGVASSILKQYLTEVLNISDNDIKRMNFDSILSLIQSKVAAGTLPKPIFEFYAERLVSTYNTSDKAFLSLYNSFGSDGNMTVYDRALLQILRSSGKTDATVYNVFQHHLSIPIESTVMVDGKEVKVLDLLYNKIYDPKILGLHNDLLYERYDRQYRLRFSVDYLVGFTTLVHFISPFRVEDGKPLSFQREANCVGTQAATRDMSRDLLLYNFPCRCISNFRQTTVQSLHTFALLGQTSCIESLIWSKKSKRAALSESVHMDSVLYAFIKTRGSNLNSNKRQNSESNRTSLWAHRVHSSASKLLGSSVLLEDKKMELKKQLDCFQFEFRDGNKCLITYACQPCPPLTRTMIELTETSDSISNLIDNPSISEDSCSNFDDPNINLLSDADECAADELSTKVKQFKAPYGILILAASAAFILLLLWQCFRKRAAKKSPQLAVSRPVDRPQPTYPDSKAGSAQP